MLQTEHTALRAFVHLLETEQGVLLNDQAEQLLPLAERKTEATHVLSELIMARRNKLSALGVDLAPGSQEAWLQAHAADSLPVWRNIQQLVTQAQQLNQSNGELIQIKLRNNQQALNVLHNAAQNAFGLYGADGQPHLATSGRTLGSG